MDAFKRFSQYLNQNELKTTPERVTVFREILEIKKHFDPDSLWLRLKARNEKISRATVYRTLDLLVNSGLVKKTNFGNASAYYESNIDPKSHDHFVCIGCGQIIEFFDEDLLTIHKRLGREKGIIVMDYTHQVYGKCKDCQQ